MKLSKPGILGLISFFSYADMGIGPVGTGLLPQSVFGLFERFGTFAVVVFNEVPGMYLFFGKFNSDCTEKVRRIAQ